MWSKVFIIRPKQQLYQYQLYLLTIFCCFIAVVAATPCPILDGSAPNTQACACDTTINCLAGEYCLKGADQPCAYFPRCRSQSKYNLNNCVRCNPDNDYLCAECKSSSLLNHDGECVEPPTIETIGDTFVGYRKFAAGDGEEPFKVWGPAGDAHMINNDVDTWLNTDKVFSRTKPIKLFSTPGGKHSHLGRDCINSNDPSKTEIQICALAVLTIDGVSFSRERTPIPNTKKLNIHLFL